MTNRQENYCIPVPQKNDLQFLYDKIITLEQELSDLTFEFKRTVKDLMRN
jgi:hypothetical protein